MPKLFLKFPVWQAPTEGAGTTEPQPADTTVAPTTSLLSGNLEGTTGATDGTETTASPETKPAEGGQPAPKAPEAAEGPAPFDVAALTLPEGVTLAEETTKEFAELLNNAELTPQERGQQLIDMYTKNTAAMAEAAQSAQVAAWTDLNTTWRTEVAALPEFTGKVDAELGAIKQVLTGPTFGATKEFFSALDLTGAGNNPHILQMLHKLVAPYREGKPVTGDPVRQAGSMLASMYPSMKKE